MVDHWYCGSQSTPHPSRPAADPPSPSRGEVWHRGFQAPDGFTTTGQPSPLEGEGARRADEGSLPRARKDWRFARTQKLRGYARSMRSAPTEAEDKCWQLLRDRRFERFKFRRQLPFGSYIADFICLEAKLVIELDGSQHAESDYDERRNAYFAQQGFHTLRFWNHEILAQPGMILDTIWSALAPHAAQAQPYSARYFQD